MQKKAYQELKNSLLPALYEKKDTLFTYLYEKKPNLKKNQKITLLNILDQTKGLVSFYDIVCHLIANNDVDALKELILSDRVSSSKKAILCGYDSCLLCKKNTSCRKELSALSSPDRVNFLLYLRFVKAKAVLSKLKLGINAPCFKILVREPILMKYVANYTLVVDIKNELKSDGSIRGNMTLYKGTGKYCPFEDLYEKI